MSDANPYQSPHELGAQAVTERPAWRFLPMTIGLVFGLLGLLLVALGTIGLMIQPSQDMVEIVGVYGIFGSFTAIWFGAAWGWYRARYILGSVLTVLGCIPLALIVFSFAVVAGM